MTTEKFKASVQYNDLQGSSAADNADFGDATKWLSENGLIDEQENLVGIKVYIGENHCEHNEPVFVEFLIDSTTRNLNDVSGAEGSPIALRRVSKDMSINDFFALFKRFEITLSSMSELENKHYSYES
ncbi:hypothetical protein N5C36_07165 [Shewanella xiamenensis]|uniref:hypothetical protein n=1 Tax=Shewanella xiamenensis TaxID=332186 RepID=UPI00244952EC|nr:hypothetical protein [Shewanella xiamenensis]MDH1313864.1 hypothetical protein [Shewanella xiamenensis]MDI5877812.1 hypothetical protein [Shewanella xiamenensis]